MISRPRPREAQDQQRTSSLNNGDPQSSEIVALPITPHAWMIAMTIDENGWITDVRRIESPNFDGRQPGIAIDMIVIHSISLPPGQFGGDGVERLFTNRCDPAMHPCFAELQAFRVSSHFFIRRTGEIIQFVSTLDRAWHAGQSKWHGRERCNDFSIGIELEGGDLWPYEEAQYRSLITLIDVIRTRHPIKDIVGHDEIAPDRKTDPGPLFDWSRLRAAN